MTVCNMSIECGSRGGLIAPDEVTFSYLKGREFAPKGKEKLTDERYNKMVEQIKAGKFSREKALNDFDLSQFQKDMLP